MTRLWKIFWDSIQEAMGPAEPIGSPFRPVYSELYMERPEDRPPMVMHWRFYKDKHGVPCEEKYVKRMR